MRHHRSDVVHALLPPKHQIAFGNLNGHAMTIGEALRDLRSASALAALKAVVSFPRLCAERLRNVIKHHQRIEQKKVIVQVLLRFKFNRQMQCAQA